MKFRIKSILTSLFGLFLMGNTNAQWITEKCPTTSNLNSISLFSTNSGWIVGDNGTILYKYNDAWIKYQNVTKANLYSVCLTNKNEGWAVGSFGTILHYDGTKWEDVQSPTQRSLYSVSFRDSTYGIAVGDQGTVVIYKNGSWTLLESETMGNLYAVSVKEDLSMLAGGIDYMSIPMMTISEVSKKVLNKSFDPGFYQIKSLAILDKNNVWAVGRPGTILHFDGIRWKRFKPFEKLPSLRSVYFSDKNTGIAVGYGGTILSFSEDGWSEELSEINVILNGACILGDTSYAVGNNGTIVSLYREPEIVTIPNKINSSVERLESYPNPSTIVLNITIPEGDDFSTGLLTVTNASGKVVLTQKLDNVASGQIYPINTSKLGTGLYMVSIKSTGNRMASAKFIVRH